MKEYLLVSSCLFGKNTKYNGKNNLILGIEKLKEKYNIILMCPEAMGGLPIPRKPSEILHNRVVSKDLEDVTDAFTKGAERTLALVKKYHIKKAVLKEFSPSCGSKLIYDGSFSNHKIEGMGVAARLLKEYGVTLYNENEIDELLKS